MMLGVLARMRLRLRLGLLLVNIGSVSLVAGTWASTLSTVKLFRRGDRHGAIRWDSLLCLCLFAG